MYCWGNFLSYAPNNLKYFDGLVHPGAQPDALYVIPLTLITQAIAMPFGPILSKQIGLSNTLLLGSWIVAAAVYFASFQTKLALFMAFYSLMFGAGAGLAYTAPMAAGWKWKPNSKGLVSGGILAGFGLGGFIFSLIGSAHVNPSKFNLLNGRFPDSVYAAFPSMLQKLAIIYAIVATIGSLLVIEKPEASSPYTLSSNINDRNSDSITSDDPSAFLAQNQQTSSQLNQFTPVTIKPTTPKLTPTAIKPTTPVAVQATGLTVVEALKTPQFWLMWFMIVSSATAGLNTVAVYKLFAATSNALNGDSYQILVGGIGAIINGVGRLLWGIISDSLGFKRSFTALTLLQATCMLTYPFSVHNKATFALNTCLLFFCLAGNFALMPPAVQRMFGTANGAVIYGIIFSAFAIASVLGGILTKALSLTVGWSGVFKVLAAMSLVAMGMVSRLQPIPTYKESSV